MKIDMHCHTKEGSPDGKVSLLDEIQILKEKGYDGMVITDHDSYKGCRYYRSLPKSQKVEGFTVLYGIEYDTIDGGHMLIIMPDGIGPRLLEIRGLPVGVLVEIVHHYGGIIGPAHPCGEKFLSIFSTGVFRYSKSIIKRFDFIENHNACEEEESNQAARRLARKYRIPGVGGSDAHKSDCVGLGYSIFQEDIHNEQELIGYIKAHKTIISGGSHYEHTTKAKLGKANNILVYLFWFYNKFLAVYRAKSRTFEIRSTNLIESILTARECPRSYITLDTNVKTDTES